MWQRLVDCDVRWIPTINNEVGGATLSGSGSAERLVELLSGAENFFESHDGWLEQPKQRLKPIALVLLPDKTQDRRLSENPCFIRVSGVFCTTKGWTHTKVSSPTELGRLDQWLNFYPVVLGVFPWFLDAHSFLLLKSKQALFFNQRKAFLLQC